MSSIVWVIRFVSSKLLGAGNRYGALLQAIEKWIDSQNLISRTSAKFVALEVKINFWP